MAVPAKPSDREAAVQRVAQMLQIGHLLDRKPGQLSGGQRQRTRTTTVYVTHDQVEAMTLGDRIAVMKDGLVQQFGTPAEIYGRPANRFVAEFIGSPATNMVDACLFDGSLTVREVALPLTEAQMAAVRAHARKEFTCGLRPEQLTFADSGLPGTLSMIEPTGPETYATVETAAGRLTARVPGLLAARVGDQVHLMWNPADAHLFDLATGQRLVY